MAALDRTAYPRYGRIIAQRDLLLHYTLSADEKKWLKTVARGHSRQLACAVLLKGIQHLGFFPAFDTLPAAVLAHLRSALALPPKTTTAISERSRYTYYARIRQRLQVITDGRDVRHRALVAIYEAAQVMDNPADLNQRGGGSTPSTTRRATRLQHARPFDPPRANPGEWAYCTTSTCTSHT